MDRTDSRFAPSPGTASDDVAPPFNSQAGDRHDLLAFEPVPLRYRTDGLTPEKQRAYVEALADTGLVREAAARVGVSEQAINRVRRRADAVGFDRACEAAHMFGARRLRSVAFERAIEGTLKGHYYHGELVSQERVYDNRLLTYLLGKTGHLLEPPEQARAICGDWQRHMDALEQGLPPPEPGEFENITDLLVWQEDDGAWRTSCPPPEGFDGYEDGVYDGKVWYCRSLSAEEQSVIDSREAEEQAEDHARRDRFFGFPGGRNSTPREAETTEPSPSFRRKPESMNTEDRGSDPPCSWIPDRVRDDESRPPTSKPPSPGILGDDPPGAFA